MEAAVTAVQETVQETLVITAIDTVTTVNALVIMFPRAVFERQGHEVRITATREELERIHALLQQLEAATQDW